jgi:protein pelota
MNQALRNFYEQVMQQILRHANFAIVKCIILASPGFVKVRCAHTARCLCVCVDTGQDEYVKYMHEESVRRDIRELIENKNKFLAVRSSSGYKHALKEVFADPSVQARLQDTKALNEVSVLSEFYGMLKKDADRAPYGPSYVAAVVDQDINAIEKLLVTDELFRSSDLVTRKKYVALVDRVKEAGADVHIFSDQHVSGERE